MVKRARAEKTRCYLQTCPGYGFPRVLNRADGSCRIQHLGHFLTQLQGQPYTRKVRWRIVVRFVRCDDPHLFLGLISVQGQRRVGWKFPDLHGVEAGDILCLEFDPVLELVTLSSKKMPFRHWARTASSRGKGWRLCVAGFQPWHAEIYLEEDDDGIRQIGRASCRERV